MVKAGRLDVAVEDAASVGEQRCVEKGHIRSIGQNAAVNVGIVRKFAAGANPDVLDRLKRLVTDVVGGIDRTKLKRSLSLPVSFHRLRGALQYERLEVALAVQFLWWRNLGHRKLMIETGFGNLERRRHRKDGLAMLQGDDPSRGETPAVADTVDLVDNRHRRIAGPHEVAMQRMGATLLDGSRRRNKGLTDDLAAKNPLPADLGA